MSRAIRRANELVEALRNEQPARYELARRVSIAVRIDQPFLRSVRLEQVPQAGTRDEVELWFGPLVESFNAGGFVFFPEVANVLRDSLRGEPQLVSSIHALLTVAHGHLAPVLQLEERLTAEALAGRPLKKLEQTLAPAMRAMLNPQRSALSRWAQRALPRLPPEVQSLPIAEACQQRAELLSALPGADASATLGDWRRQVELREETVSVSLCHTGSSLQLGLQPDSRRHAEMISIMHAVPQLVQVSGRSGSRLLRLTEANSLTVPVDSAPVRVSFADGQVFRIAPSVESPRKQPLVFVSYSWRDAEYTEFLVKMLDEHLQDRFTLQLARDDSHSSGSTAQDIESRLRASDMVLALLGDSWFEPRRKIADDSALQMLEEIETALKIDIPIVPVWIGKLSRRGKGQLPGSLSALTERRMLDLGPRPEQGEPIRRLAREIRNTVNRGRSNNTLAPFRSFRDRLPGGSLGPEMVVLPAGTFWMGSDPSLDSMASDSEQPRHRVTIVEPFAMARYPLTFEEYERFANEAGREAPHDEGWGRARRPVINVSWIAARDYVQWLSECTGRDYRLPTEAEWEYAARAGTITAWFGGVAEADGGNTHGWHRGNSNERTWPVGDKRGNRWGLHDIMGNVSEWVEDVWHENYRGAPGDGDAWVETNNAATERRVLRGGSWNSNSRALRSAYRDWGEAEYGGSRIGFRVVCRPH